MDAPSLDGASDFLDDAREPRDVAPERLIELREGSTGRNSGWTSGSAADGITSVIDFFTSGD